MSFNYTVKICCQLVLVQLTVSSCLIICGEFPSADDKILSVTRYRQKEQMELENIANCCPEKGSHKY